MLGRQMPWKPSQPPMKSQASSCALPAWWKRIGRRAGEIVDADVGDLEQDLSAVGEPAGDQVLHHLLLAVDRDALADQLAEIDVVQRAVEAEMHAVVEQALALHALADAGLDQQVARPLLDQAGADAALDVVAAAVLQDDDSMPSRCRRCDSISPAGPAPTIPTCVRIHFLRVACPYPAKRQKPDWARTNRLASAEVADVQAATVIASSRLSTITGECRYSMIGGAPYFPCTNAFHSAV